MGFYFNQKDQVLNPLTVLSWLHPVDRPVDRSWRRSTDRSTDVHRRARQFWQEGRSTDPVDRPESSALWKAPVDRAADRTESLLSVSWPRSTDRSTDGSTVWNMTVGRSTGRSTDRPDRPQRLVFFQPINLGVWALFFYKIFGDF